MTNVVPPYFEQERTPLLSVVMPVHNPHKYLSLCLESVLQQTFNDYELIAIDDASSDDSYSVLKEYERRDKRLIVMQNKQCLGAAYTRNRGLHIARGEYIIFLDADDFFEIDFFEQMVTAIKSAKADVAICAILWRDERDGTERLKLKPPRHLINLFKQPFCPSDFNNKIFKFMAFAPFNKLIRRELILKKRIEFQDLSNSNDVYFGVMTVAEAERVVYLPQPYIHYRYNSGFQISTNRHKQPMNIFFAFQKIREEFIARGLWSTFCKAYYDMAIPRFFDVARKAYEPEPFLNYIRGEGGNLLGLLNLQRRDFSSLRTYGLYQLLFDGEKAILGNVMDTFVFLIKTLARGDFSVLYLLVSHAFFIIVRKCKTSLMK